MIAIAAREAKNRFGELLDTAQREPVSIEKHGRKVAVILSATEYDELKLARLRGIIGEAGEQYKRGEYVDGEKFFDELNEMFENIKSNGKKRRAKNVNMDVESQLNEN